MSESSTKADTVYQAGCDGNDRRTNNDRRQHHLKGLFVQFRSPRRRAGRRSTDAVSFHADFHDPALLAVVLVTLSLCIVDVYATIAILQSGGIELNPIMQELISTNVSLFFFLKYGVTASCLFILITYKRFRLYKGFGGLQTLYGVLLVYIMLVVYEIRLLSLTI